MAYTMETEESVRGNTKARPTADQLAGDVTVLRPVTELDLPRLQAWDNDPEITALMGKKYVDSTAATWFEALGSGRQTRALAIETRAGRLIGELELAQVNWRNGSAEIRICIGEKDCWNQGYGSDAMRTAIRLAFEFYGLRVIYLRVFKCNRRAVKVYERIGFRTEAVLQPSERRQDPSPVLLMTLTRERWNRLRMQSA